MSLEVLTKNDLDEFKKELFKFITDFISKSNPRIKEILTNDEVKELLSISDGTLRKYRILGKISFTKIDRTYYYQYKDILNLIESNKKNTLSPNLNGKC